MEQDINNELLKNIYNRAKEFAIAKFGHGEPDTIRLDDDGTLTAIFEGCERGFDDYETIKAEDLTADLDAIAKERLERLEHERIKAEAYNREQQRLREIREKNERKQQYLKLKKEFE